MYRRLCARSCIRQSLLMHVRLLRTSCVENVDPVGEDSLKDSSVREAVVISEVNIPNQIYEDKHGGIKLGDVHPVSEKENVFVEMNQLKYLFSQEGPYIGSKRKDATSDSVSDRGRRKVVRVPQPEVSYVPNETSFRRLPKNTRIPNEYELRALYPMSTGLALVEGQADCVDHSAFSPDEDPSPMVFSMIVPSGWSKTDQCPYMVVLPDHRGVARDFEDVCANFFERPVHRQLMTEQKWVVVAPVINIKHNFQIPVEAIVARFCDWIVENFNVEHGRVHLFGKGNGAYVALRTVMEHKDVAISVTAILGRSGTPFRPLDRPQDKIRNLNGVHSLVFVPGLLRKQDWYYKFKFMMDMGRVRPALRNVHFADVRDHQVYYAINPYEFWNYMNFFRQHNIKMVTESGYGLH
ncbi:uncharacterized protein TEOVI_000046700 [Trypanosoma equiperdum]|uniref:Uncharacterized protein n=4 Tax=Trypanozoon TaxID=39700 RepID=Q38FW3_TRYB2|nr:hypothetical protein, conserved [Trypanosoma brucei gambiense DAL972]XP_803505.1 hypothetical protein, conserved [Trypanosoma brucei brucei TREU927]RHW67346.1 hypothetical protein DPX39_000020100 [Trypanosoma brucei equiperdum]SCU67507.1 hypothetical protein, conserved [Trypanosoma equiperdum]EAN76307.1 hypothetical protein, conserved [Trypanosoma brucei brucei TREU927]CBH13982.1 hypothetical protein, conserved [Trypanosoma brucei gambiense DAL972]|eukprot:XP_011776256.1 hypothetical protein, conserved [Trypanosoma brucei gambiense DAL972]